MEITLGGDRLGSGNKNKIELHNYYRSTHNLSQRFTSTMGVGMCVPCLVIPALRGDVFDININGACRTIPTNAPLFSTFKMQVDVFECAVRLYQAILHNNPLFIGLKMKDVKFPLMELKCIKGKITNGKCADTALMKYLGLSGMGFYTENEGTTCVREINAIPMLAYYDICKTYYSNKQEDIAYVMSSEESIINAPYSISFAEVDGYEATIHTTPWTVNGKTYNRWVDTGQIESGVETELSEEPYSTIWPQQNLWIRVTNAGTLLAEGSLDNMKNLGWIDYTYQQHVINIVQRTDTNHLIVMWQDIKPEYGKKAIIDSFRLENIDKMRLNILSSHTLGTPFKITSSYSDKPYVTLCEANETGETKNNNELQGLFIKTYQADLFNAWVNTEWIDGENGIAEMTKIAVSDGAVYMDAMLLAEKTYNMLNRIAVAGGTYEDWQNVVYTESSRKHIESPIYCGGLSNEIIFEEIVQTTPTEGAPLGTLGGRGIAVKRKGGNVSIKCDEASYIIGIVSITPRIYYTQGNEFYMTELKSMDDMHKPALDGIGFQNLIGERLLWTTTKLEADGRVKVRPIIGKVPAWIEYMTAIDKAYGEFCDVKKQGSMILGRHYEFNGLNGEIRDATTYIDPAKYNYVFGKDDLLAQNFWVQIDFDIKARRLMSAKQIPNL